MCAFNRIKIKTLSCVISLFVFQYDINTNCAIHIGGYRYRSIICIRVMLFLQRYLYDPCLCVEACGVFYQKINYFFGNSVLLYQ